MAGRASNLPVGLLGGECSVRRSEPALRQATATVLHESRTPSASFGSCSLLIRLEAAHHVRRAARPAIGRFALLSIFTKPSKGR